MKALAVSLVFLLLATAHAAPGWENKVIGNVSIEVPSDCRSNVQQTPGGGAVRKMKKYSFRNRVLNLELVFLSFAPGTGGNLDGAAANMSAQLRAAPGAESLAPWKTTTVSGRPARRLATKPSRTGQGRVVTLIDDTKAKDQLVIVDISYDSTSSSAKGDAERIMKSVTLK
jgi:hypothetical protein